MTPNDSEVTDSEWRRGAGPRVTLQDGSASSGEDALPSSTVDEELDERPIELTRVQQISDIYNRNRISRMVSILGSAGPLSSVRYLKWEIQSPRPMSQQRLCHPPIM